MNLPSTLTQRFYFSLVKKDQLSAVLSLIKVESAEESTAAQTLIRILDYTVMDTLLQSLPDDHHPAFLALLEKDLTDASILQFIDTHAEGSTELLREVLERTLLALHLDLSSDEQ